MYAQKGHTSRSNLSHERFWQPNEFLLPYPFCLCRLQRHARIPQHSNLVLLPQTYTVLKSPIGPKSPLNLYRPAEKQCTSGHPCILSWEGCPPSRPPVHWLSRKRQRSGKRQRYICSRESKTHQTSVPNLSDLGYAPRFEPWPLCMLLKQEAEQTTASPGSVSVCWPWLSVPGFNQCLPIPDLIAC